MKTSKVYSELRPYIVKQINDTLTRRGLIGSSSNGTGGAAVVGAHALDGAFHTGTLADSQAPQFLKRDGTRSLTGDLAVDANVTIDGVDIGSPGNGLTVSGNQLAVNEGYAFNWTAQHTFNADPQINANIDFIGGNRSITGSGDVHLEPAGNVTTTSAVDWETTTHTSGFLGYGWRIAERTDGAAMPIPGASHLDIRSIYAEELHVTAFIADTARVQIGETFLSQSMALVATNEDVGDGWDGFTIPAIDGTVKIYVEDAPNLIGQVFANGDWVLIRFINREDATAWTTATPYYFGERASNGGNTYGCKVEHTSSAINEPGVGANWTDYWVQLASPTSLTVASCWGQVSAYDGEASIEGVQSYTYTHKWGPSGLEAKPGSLIIDFGTSGAAFIHSSVIDADPPWTRYRTWSGANPFTPGNWTTHTAVGNLNGISDTDFPGMTGHGFYSTNTYLKGELQAAAGVVILDSGGIRVDSASAGTESTLNAYKFTASGSTVSGMYAFSSGKGLTIKAENDLDPIISVGAVDDTGSGQATAVFYAERDGQTPAWIRFEIDASTSEAEIVAGDEIRLEAPTVVSYGDLLPLTDDTYDLGSASFRWATLYVDQLVATTISGDTLDGQEWEFPGSMVIDANSASDTTLSVVNQGAGSADLAVDRHITLGGTVDGVDLSSFKGSYDSHVADADAHHDSATAGDGIISNLTPSAQVISVDSTVVRTSRTLTAGTGLTGGGNLSADRTFNVNQAFAFAWTANHTHAGNVQFIGTRSISSSGSNHLNLVPGGDLVLDSTKTWRSSDYADGIPITGFSNHINSLGNRQLTINSIKADELHVRLFVADTVRVDVGEEYWGKSMGIVYEDFTTPGTIGGTVNIKVEDSPAFAGALFSNDDWILIRIIDDSGGGLVVASIWGQVSSYVDLGDDAEGRGHQQWTLTLRQGPVNQEVKAGNVIVNFGASGQGYVHLSTLASAQGPWIQIGTWSGANPYTPGNRSVETQMGNLDSISDPEMNPTGFGLFGTNVFLRGELRTLDSAVDDDGFSTQIAERDSGLPGTDVSAIYWWPDINNRTGDPVFQVNAWVDTQSDPVNYDSAWVWIKKQATSEAAIIRIQAQGAPGDNAQITIDSRNTIAIRTDDVLTNALQFRPEADLGSDLGTASFRWGTLYVDQLIATTISGATLDGAEWEYTGGNMVIDANNTSPTIVSITNQNTGTASLSVEGNISSGGSLTVGTNIVVTGTVDGVNISAHDVDPDAHHDAATAGDGIVLSGQQVSVDLATASGLVFSTGDLAVNVGDGLEIAANAVAIDLATASGLTFSAGDLAIADTIAGSGLAIASKILSVNVGNGLEIAADAVVVDLATTSGLEFSTGDLQIADSIAGNGIGISAKVLSVGAGNGITTSADAVAISLASPSGLEFSAGDLRIADTIAGGGLAIASKVLSVNVGDGLELVTDTVAVDLATNSGLTFSSADLALGTPSQLTTASTNSVTTTTHNHSIQHSSNPGANARILSSTAAGGLTLQNITVNGNVDILSGGDLTVGANILFVDASLQSVGINRAPDPQFALDVAGPARASFFVGPHAIQLKEASAIWHFDGPGPIETNWYGTPNPHMGQAPVGEQFLHYLPGKFQKALAMSHGTITNLIQNPSFETGLTGWTVAGSPTTTTGLSWTGLFSAELDNGEGISSSSSWITLNNGQTIYVSAAFYCSTGATGQLRVIDHTNLITRSTVTTQDTNEWEIVCAQWTNDTGSAVFVRVNLDNITGTISKIWADSVQATINSFGGYVDGSMPNASWNGTAHASTTTINGIPSLAFDGSAVLDSEEGTIMLWYCPFGEIAHDSNLDYIFAWRDNGGTTERVSISQGPTGVYLFQVGATQGSGGTVEPGRWVHLALTWDRPSATFACFVNGVQVDSDTDTLPEATGTPIAGIGRAPLTLTDQCGGLIDDVAVTKRRMTADEILTVYESNAPVFAESSVFTFRATPTQLVWADDEGLWMRNTTGGTVLGAYGGAAATKSWAGLTLGQNDMVIGDSNRNGYMHWDDSAGTLHVEGNIVITGGSGISSLSDAGALATLNSITLSLVTDSGALAALSSVDMSTGQVTNKTLDNIANTASFRKTAATAINGSGLVILDQTVNGVYGKVLATSISAGKILLSQAEGNLGDVADGGGYGKVLSTSISAGQILLSQASGNLSNIADGGGFGKVDSTILAAGFIQVGNGTKDSNLDGFHFSASEIVGQNNGLDQVVMNTNGAIIAGGGAVTMNASGVQINRATGSSPINSNAYNFVDGTTSVGGLFSYTPSSVHTLELVNNRTSSINAVNIKSVTNSSLNDANVTLQANRNGMTADIILQAAASGLGNPSISLTASSGAIAITSGDVTITGSNIITLAGETTVSGKAGINTSGQTHQFTVKGSNTSDANVGDLVVIKENFWSLNFFDVFSATAGHAPFQIGRRARGSLGSPAAVQNGDSLGGFSFRGYNGSGAYTQPLAVNGVVNGTVSGSSVPADLTFGAGTTTATERMRITSDGNIGINTASQFGSGTGVIGIANATAVPLTTPSGGGVLYASLGALRWRGSSGTVSLLGPAEPHCPVCGADYVVEFDNEKYGYLLVCMKCWVEELGDRPWINWKSGPED